MKNGNDSSGKNTCSAAVAAFSARRAVHSVRSLLAALLARVARADDLPHLSTTDPTAQALKYTLKTHRLPGSLHEAGQTCADLQLLRRRHEEGRVSAFPRQGRERCWCQGYAKKA